MTDTTRIRAVAAEDWAGWLPLWRGYVAFYGATVPDAVTEATWRRLLDPAVPLLGHVAERGGAVVGFSTAVLHEGTWTTAPTCYLEDLFVDPALRGGGVGRALIQNLIDLGRSRGWSRLYWHTQAGNATARRLYDSFVQADDFVRYRLALD